MLAIPSMELVRGTCNGPRPAQGNPEAAPAAHPVSAARSWAHVGFRRLHVADRDADDREGSNGAMLEDIIRDGALEIQAAGGIESTEGIERLSGCGAFRIVLGARALDEPHWLAEVADLYPDVLLVRTDVRERRVVTRGWVRNLPLDIFDVIDDLRGLPLAGLLLTAVGSGISRSSQELSLLEDVAESCDFPVIAVGGVTTMNDLRALEHRGVAAVLLDDVLLSGELDAQAVAQEFAT